MASVQTTPGILSLATLLRTLHATFHPATFVFIVFAPGTSIPGTLQTHMTFQEVEGTTVVTTLTQAKDHDLCYDFECRMITLDVHSSLDAVGFLAAITSRLALELKIGVNPVSGFYHDHLFVRAGTEHSVLMVLGQMAMEAKAQVGEAEKGESLREEK